MRVIYYTKPSFLDLALSYAGELAKQVELHLVIEITPENRQSSIFDISKKNLEEGVIDGTHLFEQEYPQIFDTYLTACKSISLVVYNCPKSFHPASWRVCFQAMHFFRKIGPDIIHIDGAFHRAAFGIWRLRGMPLLVSIHDPIPHSGKINWKIAFCRKITFPFVDRFLLHCATMQESFLNLYPSLSPEKVVHTYLAPYDIYRLWIDSPLQDNGKTILFFGRLSSYKGLEVLLQAAPIIAQQIKEVRIVIAGRPIAGYTLPTLPGLANGGKFKLLDSYIDNSRLAKLFQRATVVACPYLDATQSGVVLTAYSFNKPVVATNTGGLPEYIRPGQTGFLVEPGDHLQLAEILIKVLASPKIQSELKAGIKQIKKNELNWSSIAEQNVAIYADVLAAD